MSSRLIVKCGTVVVIALILGSSACAASGEASIGSKTSASANVESSSDKTAADPPSDTAPPPASSAPAATNGSGVRPGCHLVCVNAHRGRVTPEDEAKLTSGVTEELNLLHGCVQGAAPGLTLRFDGTGTITHFGVDDERFGGRGFGDSSCIDGVRNRKPTLSFPGPATLRCVERCPGEGGARRRTRDR